MVNRIHDKRIRPRRTTYRVSARRMHRRIAETYFLQVQQAAFDDLLYEVDVMRNIATRHDEPRQSPPPRRASVPAVAFSPTNTTPSTPGGEEEEEAVAGRLEIRVVDATGGATVVQTTADREPLQSKYRLASIFTFRLFPCMFHETNEYAFLLSHR